MKENFAFQNEAESIKNKNSVKVKDVLSLDDYTKIKNLQDELSFLNLNYGEYLEYPVDDEGTFHPYVKLDSIKKKSLSDKKIEVEEYKKQLNRQKEGIAELQIELDRIINYQIEPSIKEIMEVVDDYKERFGLAGYQVEAIHSAIKTYLERKNKIEYITNKYRDNNELFKFLFGAKPKGEIEVLKGSISLGFRCFDDRDFAYAYGGSASETVMKHLENIGGAFLPEISRRGVDNLIILEKSDAGLSTTIHEEQHAKNSMHLWREMKFNVFESKLLEDFKEADDRNAKIEILKKVWRLFIEDINVWERLKDEIICYYKDGDRGIDSIYKILSKPKILGGEYDYLSNSKGKKRIDLLNKLGVDSSNKNTYESRITVELVNVAMDHALVVEYGKVIRRALLSLYELDAFFGDKDKAINTLLVEPLLKWEKIVKRITNQREEGGSATKPIVSGEV